MSGRVFACDHVLDRVVSAYIVSLAANLGSLYVSVRSFWVRIIGEQQLTFRTEIHRLVRIESRSMGMVHGDAILLAIRIVLLQVLHKMHYRVDRIQWYVRQREAATLYHELSKATTLQAL